MYRIRTWATYCSDKQRSLQWIALNIKYTHRANEQYCSFSIGRRGCKTFSQAKTLFTLVLFTYYLVDSANADKSYRGVQQSTMY